MPAKSIAQRKLMAACEHGAGYESCPKGMSKDQMHDFAATSEKDLPRYAKQRKEMNGRRAGSSSK